jgi:hypothetical protein
MFQQNSIVYHMADTVTVANHLQHILRHQLLNTVSHASGKLKEQLQLGTGSSLGTGKQSFTPKSQAITRPVKYKYIKSLITRKERKGKERK